MNKRLKQGAMALFAVAIAFAAHAGTGSGATAQGSNEAPSLLVRFPSDPSKGYTADTVMERLERDKDRAEPETRELYARLGNPQSVRFLITTRLAPEYRRFLRDDDPAILLHSWLVTEYGGLEHTRAAKVLMQHDAMFLQVAHDYYVDFPIPPGGGTPSKPLPAHDYAAVWWNPDEAGLSLTFHQNDSGVAFAIWYSYDVDRRDMWLTLQGDWTAPDTYAGTLYRTTGPAIGESADRALVALAPVGSGSIFFIDADNALFTFSVNGISKTKTILRFPF